MNLNLDAMVLRLQEIPGYGPLFEAAYPGEPISPATVAKALAAFERTVTSGTAPFDRFVAGTVDAISAAARRHSNRGVAWGLKGVEGPASRCCLA